MLVRKHEFCSVRIISAIRLIYDEFIFLLEGESRRQRKHGVSKDNGNAGYSTWEERTHALEEMLSPALLLPRQLCGAFQSDKELALEVKELIEIWE